jgi:3-isopropylmalate dehydratase small subunit
MVESKATDQNVPQQYVKTVDSDKLDSDLEDQLRVQSERDQTILS